jgi:hypothetical protein
MQTQQINNIQEFDVQARFVRPDGSLIVNIDGPIRWASTDDTIATVIPDPTDSSRATVRSTGVPGIVHITATGDTVLGDDVLDVSGQFEVTIVESGEVTVEFVFSDVRRRE